MSKRLIFLFTLIITSYVNSAIAKAPMTPNLDPNKLTFCHMTINSDDEKKMFERKIREQSGDKEIQFVELTEMGESHEWFDNACASEIKCDVLNISGHFGGAFFGDKGLNLSADELENKTCNNSCGGILSNPAEVYLWGCNTLASKKEDSRTPEEYIQVLIEDGYTPAEAHNVASLRYSPLGESFKTQMMSAFKGVPHIYGFHSIAPLGKNVSHMIENYMDDIGDFSSHILKIRMKQHGQYIEQANKQVANPSHKIKGNRKIFNALKVTNFTQVVAQTAKCGDLVIESEEDIDKVISCNLRNEDLDLESRLALANDLINGGDTGKFIRPLTALFQEINESDLEFNNQESKIMQEILSNLSAKDELLAMTKALQSFPGDVFKIYNLVEAIGWVDKNEAEELKIDFARNIVKHPINIEVSDLLCSFEGLAEYSKKLKFEDIHPLNFESFYGTRALGCLRVSDQKVVKRFEELVKVEKNNIRVYLEYFSEVDPMNEALRKRMLELANDLDGDTSNTLRDYFSRVNKDNDQLKLLTEKYFKKYFIEQKSELERDFPYHTSELSHYLSLAIDENIKLSISNEKLSSLINDKRIHEYDSISILNYLISQTNNDEYLNQGFEKVKKEYLSSGERYFENNSLLNTLLNKNNAKINQKLKELSEKKSPLSTKLLQLLTEKGLISIDTYIAKLEIDFNGNPLNPQLQADLIIVIMNSQSSDDKKKELLKKNNLYRFDIAESPTVTIIDQLNQAINDGTLEDKNIEEYPLGENLKINAATYLNYYNTGVRNRLKNIRENTTSHNLKVLINKMLEMKYGS